MNLQPSETVMNTIIKLPVTFTPANEQNSWAPPVKFGAAATATGAQASVRITVRESSAIRFARTVKVQPRSGANAAPQNATGARSRVLRPRLFAPNHKLEHFAP